MLLQKAYYYWRGTLIVSLLSYLVCTVVQTCSAGVAKIVNTETCCIKCQWTCQRKILIERKLYLWSRSYLNSNGSCYKHYKRKQNKMQWPSFNLILTEIFLAYIIYSIYKLSLLFVASSCEEGRPCFTSYLNEKPRLQLQIYSSVNIYPNDKQLNFIYSTDDFNYTHPTSLWVYVIHYKRFTNINNYNFQTLFYLF